MTKLAIEWTAAKLAMLKAQRDEAFAARERGFEYVEKAADTRWSPVIGKHPMTVEAADELIEYLEGVFESTPTPPAQENREGEEGQ
jgi:hypothetical protein